MTDKRPKLDVGFAAMCGGFYGLFVVILWLSSNQAGLVAAFVITLCAAICAGIAATINHFWRK